MHWNKLQVLDKAFYRFADISGIFARQGDCQQESANLYQNWLRLKAVETEALSQLNAGLWD